MIRFRFALTPLDQVRPWGDPLHWFGLTDGAYWIEVGDHQLLRYTTETLRRCGSAGAPARHPYVDYYVVRLWEDVNSLTPDICEPVPDDLVPFVAGDRGSWAFDPFGPAADDDAAVVAAACWHGGHTLDLGYLRQPPLIRAWRTAAADTVTVTWQHEPDSDIRFTAEPSGRVTMPTAAFLAGVRELDRDLMAAMAQRIRELERTGAPDGANVDLDRLWAEHADRSTWLARELAREPETDWAAVRAGARRLLGLTVAGPA